MNYNYCHLCGSEIAPALPNEEHRECPGCGQRHYSNAVTCVEICLFDSDSKVLLSKRAFEPWKGKWDLPGGFLEVGETAEQAIYREVQEELGLNKKQVGQLKYVGSYASKYPYMNDTKNVLVIEFFAFLSDKSGIKPADDVADVSWVDPSTVRVDDLSIPVIKEMLKLATEINQKRLEK